MDDELFVVCPYCETPLEPAMLFDHVMQTHEAHPGALHRRSCPVCVLFYGGDPGQAANHLPTHLREHHPEMEGASRNVRSRPSPAEELDEQFDFAEQAQTVGTAFASLVLRESDVAPMAQLECAICLDVFAPGQAVLRMDCFCLYHDSCLKSWFQKCQKQNCPTHVFATDK